MSTGRCQFPDRPRFGGGSPVPTKDSGYRKDGDPPSTVDVLVDTARLAGVVEHVAGDLVATVGAGTQLHALRDTSCDHLEAYVALDQGAFTLANNGLEKGTYGFHAGVLRDSSFN